MKSILLMIHLESMQSFLIPLLEGTGGVWVCVGDPQWVLVTTDFLHLVLWLNSVTFLQIEFNRSEISKSRKLAPGWCVMPSQVPQLYTEVGEPDNVMLGRAWRRRG